MNRHVVGQSNIKTWTSWAQFQRRDIRNKYNAAAKVHLRFAIASCLIDSDLLAFVSVSSNLQVPGKKRIETIRKVLFVFR